MDESIMNTIHQLVEEEHALENRHHEDGTSPEERARLAAIEVELDRCWDLLRQRRARRSAHQDESAAHLRSADVVENYQQ